MAHCVIPKSSNFVNELICNKHTCERKSLPFWIWATLRDTSPTICLLNFSHLGKLSHSVARYGRLSFSFTLSKCAARHRARVVLQTETVLQFYRNWFCCQTAKELSQCLQNALGSWHGNGEACDNVTSQDQLKPIWVRQAVAMQKALYKYACVLPWSDPHVYGCAGAACAWGGAAWGFMMGVRWGLPQRHRQNSFRTPSLAWSKKHLDGLTHAGFYIRPSSLTDFSSVTWQMTENLHRLLRVSRLKKKTHFILFVFCCMKPIPLALWRTPDSLCIKP